MAILKILLFCVGRIAVNSVLFIGISCCAYSMEPRGALGDAARGTRAANPEIRYLSHDGRFAQLERSKTNEVDDGSSTAGPDQDEIDPRVRAWELRQEPTLVNKRGEPRTSATMEKGRPYAGRKAQKMLMAYAKISEFDDDVVAINFRQNGRSVICTGEALSADAILTAAHCTCGDPGSYTVVAGPHATDHVPDKKKFKVSEIVHLPGYSCNRSPERQAGFDIGLIKLSQSSEYLAAKVRPITLYGEAIRNRPENFEVFGYGFTEQGKIGERRGAGVPVVSYTCTERRWRQQGCSSLREFVLSAQLSSGTKETYPRLRDSCGGDSGGPVFWYSAERRVYLVGIVSRGLNTTTRVAGQPCGGGGIYSVVGRHSVIAWLESEGVNVCFRSGPCGNRSPRE